MILTRRAALGGLGATLGVGLAARAYGAAPFTEPAVALTQSRLAQGGWARGVVRSDVTALSLDDKAVPFDKQGNFFIAFDRDALAAATLSARNPHSNIGQMALAIAPGEWQIEQIDAPFHPPAMPDETFERIRKEELARIDAARAKDTGAQGWRQSFVWPVRGRISGRFGAQRVYRGTPGSYHSGIDIATGASGTPYLAPADGVVVLAATGANGGPFTLEGNLLMIDHGMGLSSAFLHSEMLLVGEGERVTQGQPIGHIGQTGRATGPHLHWSLRWHEARLDPALLAGPQI